MTWQALGDGRCENRLSTRSLFHIDRRHAATTTPRPEYQDRLYSYRTGRTQARRRKTLRCCRSVARVVSFARLAPLLDLDRPAVSVAAPEPVNAACNRSRVHPGSGCADLPRSVRRTMVELSRRSLRHVGRGEEKGTTTPGSLILPSRVLCRPASSTARRPWSSHPPRRIGRTHLFVPG
jgi:hypothetical protein